MIRLQFRAPSSSLLVVAAATLVLWSSRATAQPTPAADGRAVVYSAEVDSIIHPVSAQYMIETIERADAENAALVVFTLRTPGGLVDSTRDIVAKMISARTPIAVYVAPSGARAASAGFIITIAADIAAMAPGTHIGAAHPVSGGGEAMDETSSKKAAEDMAAGRLVAPLDLHLPLASAYYLVCQESAASRPAVTLFRDWLLAEVVRGPRTAAPA